MKLVEEISKPQFTETNAEQIPNEFPTQEDNKGLPVNNQNQSPNLSVINPNVRNKYPYIRIALFFLIFLISVGAVFYILSFKEEVINDDEIDKERPFNFHVSITPYSNNKEQNLTSSPTPSIPSYSPSPTSTQKIINLISKGKVDLEKSVTANLIGAWEEDNLIKISVELKNDSSEIQKLFYFLFEIESQKGWDEEKQRFITKKGQPFEGEIILNPQDEKNVTISFERVLYPYSWNYWTSNKKVLLGYTQ